MHLHAFLLEYCATRGVMLHWRLLPGMDRAGVSAGLEAAASHCNPIHITLAAHTRLPTGTNLCMASYAESGAAFVTRLPRWAQDLSYATQKQKCAWERLVSGTQLPMQTPSQLVACLSLIACCAWQRALAL